MMCLYLIFDMFGDCWKSPLDLFFLLVVTHVLDMTFGMFALSYHIFGDVWKCVLRFVCMCLEIVRDGWRCVWRRAEEQ